MSNYTNLSHAELLKLVESQEQAKQAAEAELSRIKREAELAQKFSAIYINENKTLCVKGSRGEGTIGRKASGMLSFAEQAINIPEFVKLHLKELAENDEEKKLLINKANRVLAAFQNFAVKES
jgi:hypothetical protein